MAEEVVTVTDRVAGVDPDPHSYYLALEGYACRLLNGEAKVERLRRGSEGKHVTVALRFDHNATELAGRAPDDSVVPAQQVKPTPVAESLVYLFHRLDVGEDDRNGAVRCSNTREVGTILAHRVSHRAEGRRVGLAKGLLVRDAEGDVKLHDLPRNTLEMQDRHQS